MQQQLASQGAGDSKTYLTLYLAICLLATNGVFAKYLPLDAVSQTFIRSGFAALLMIGLLFLTRRRIVLRNRQDVLGVYGLGIIMGIHWVTFFHAMLVSTVAVGMLAMFSFPVMTVLLEPLFARKSLRLVDIAAALVVFIGIAIMAAPGVLNADSGLLAGVAWGVFSAVLFSLRNLWQKYSFAHVSSDRLMLHQLIAIIVMLAAFSDWSTSLTMPTETWLVLLLMGVVTTAAAHTMLVSCYKRLAAKSVAMISCLQPPIAALLAWWLLDESVSINVFIGGGIILAVAAFESMQQSES